MNLHKHVWTEALQMDDFKQEDEKNVDKLKKLVSLAEGYEKRVKEETELSKEQLKTRYVGKVDPKKRMCICPVTSCRTLLIEFPRHRGRWPAAHRRQHRCGFETDDRQGGLLAQECWRKRCGQRRDGGR